MFVSLIQGTPEWHRWRDGIELIVPPIGGSMLSKLVGDNDNRFGNITDEFCYRVGLSQKDIDDDQRARMNRGNQHEDFCRQFTERVVGHPLPAECHQWDDDSTLRCSLDGRWAATGVTWECKVPAWTVGDPEPTTFKVTRQDGKPPWWYAAQVQGGLLAAGNRVGYFGVYLVDDESSPTRPAILDHTLCRVELIPEYHDRILEGLSKWRAGWVFFKGLDAADPDRWHKAVAHWTTLFGRPTCCPLDPVSHAHLWLPYRPQ